MATLKQLGFGPSNNLSNLLTLPLPMPANSEVSTMGTSSHGKTFEETVLTLATSHIDDLDLYSQISRLFQQIAQTTGHLINTLILEWALLHTHTDMVKRQITHSRILH